MYSKYLENYEVIELMLILMKIYKLLYIHIENINNPINVQIIKVPHSRIPKKV